MIEKATIALKRSGRGRSARSQMLLGLRGVGKTVLLNHIEARAAKIGCQSSFIEAPEKQNLSHLLYPKIHQVLRRMSARDSAKAAAHRAMRALRGFASAFKIKVGDVSISVDPDPGVADSGQLDTDLIDLFIRVGETAKAADTVWALFIDEVQYLRKHDLAALIVALHRSNQINLPILFFGAGLPQLAALSGEAKSYAERLFDYWTIGALEPSVAAEALSVPIKDEDEKISPKAIDIIVAETQGYPYFLQEWGHQVWNIAKSSPIRPDDATNAGALALKRLDEGFFRVRFDRLTPKERDYVFAMARLGKGPYRSGDVASELGESVQALGPRRSSIIAKGMIYSPQHGDIDFTVPMFDDFLRRQGAHD